MGYLLYTALVRRYEIDSRAVLLPVLFSLFLAIAAAGLWEVYEFCGDTFFHLQAQGGSLTDTMTDIIAGSCGALIGAAFLASSLKKHKQPQKDKRQDLFLPFALVVRNRSFRRTVEQQLNTPKAAQAHNGVYNTRCNRRRTAANPCDEVKLRQPYQQPVDAADDGN